MESSARKIVLVSTRGYESSHDALLLSLIERRIFLFCAVGQDCALWEEIMDELIVGPTGEYEWDILTSSHPDENVEEVIAFAELCKFDEPSDVEVIEV